MEFKHLTPLDLGFAVKDADFLGRRSLSRPDAVRSDRKQLVGLLPDDPTAVLPEGAQLVAVLPTGYACSLNGPPRGALSMALQALTLLLQERGEFRARSGSDSP